MNMKTARTFYRGASWRKGVKVSLVHTGLHTWASSHAGALMFGLDGFENLQGIARLQSFREGKVWPMWQTMVMIMTMFSAMTMQMHGLGKTVTVGEGRHNKTRFTWTSGWLWRCHVFQAGTTKFPAFKHTIDDWCDDAGVEPEEHGPAVPNGGKNHGSWKT